MAFGILFLGLIFLVAAYQNTQDELFALLKQDFTGSGNFISWVLAFVFLIALGNIKAIRPITDAFLVLVLIALILAQYRQKDLFASFVQQVKDGTNG